ncbi:armadillo-type protein [Cokeromyces recurvatus]|uniref:armadillo-type protein n=1 Tax=Cokeromyces recurvatus TaxID=90255 RepID=UPI0022202912|nr:armadillo-type protein [Cokeromyces recurvatus]KAI7902274.1 armadillo-type protein [Cokeromyces recurvatus]
MSQQDERIAYFTTLCEQLYNPKSSEERLQVQKILEQSFPTFTNTNVLPSDNITALHSFNIHSPTDTASALRILLESSPSPYVQIFALGRLKQLIQTQFSLFNQESKIQLRSFLLQHAFIHPDLVPFAITHLAAVLASLTLLGWTEIEQYRNVHKDILQFIQASVDHRIVGLQILAIMVQDINPPSFTRSASKFRKAAGEFRDTQLLDICKTAYKTLEASTQHIITTNNQQQEQRLREAALNLLIKCFSYDFNGTSVDESGEDVGIVQIPASWKPLLEDPEFLNTMFKAYDEFQPPLSSKVMECLVQIASVRKTLFSDQEIRSRFVMRIMQGIQDIILTSRGLNDADNYNEFCRLLFRFRASVPLNEMVEKAGYLEWIELIADFSLKAFQSWKFAPTTSMYVLSFWARIVQSMTYYQQLGEAAVEKLGRITIELVRSYVSTTVESVPVRIQEALDDPLDNEETLIETLNMLGQIAHCKYEASSTAMMGLFDPITVQYQELIMTIQQQMASNNIEGLKEALEIIENKFAWLVYIMASFIGNRSAFLNSADLDKMDSEITTKVLQLMNVQQTLLNQHGNAFMNEKLDLAFIYFFQQFKKSYMSESNGRDIYSKLSKVFGISDQIMMLDVIMRKIVSNLQYWSNNGLLIQRTLELFNELATGYGASKNLRKIETTRLIMQNHMATEFAFCQSTSNKRQDENRILFFQVLCKLLFADDNVDERTFYEFMKPFDIRFDNLGLLDNVEAFRFENTRRALRDIFVDLCGFISPMQTRRHFNLFFEWFYEGDYSSILLRAIEAWSPDPIVNSLLSFFSEFVHNKSQRLSFEVSSPNGILIFRDASQIICSFGQKILNKQQELGMMDSSNDDIYEYKYKGISTCFSIMSKCLGGRYINFGVLWLYQDKAIEDALNMIIQLMLSIPIDDLLSYPKLSTAFFHLLDGLTYEELMSMPSLPSDAFVYIMQVCEQGVESSDMVIRGHACAAVYNICSYLIKQAEKSGREKEVPSSTNTASTNSNRRRSQQLSSSMQDNHWLLAYIHQQYPQTLPTLLYTVFNLVLFDDNSDQWTLSRPLYGLVFLQRDYMVKYINAVIEQQLPERRAFVTTSLNNLIEGVNWNFTPRDRERFTQNLSSFRRLLGLNSIALTPLLAPPSFY